MQAFQDILESSRQVDQMIMSLNRASESLQFIQDTITSLESIPDNEISSTALEMYHLSKSNICTLLGLDYNRSLEDYKDFNLKLSLEEEKSFLSKVWDKITHFFQAILDKVTEILKRVLFGLSKVESERLRVKFKLNKGEVKPLSDRNKSIIDTKLRYDEGSEISIPVAVELMRNFTKLYDIDVFL